MLLPAICYDDAYGSSNLHMLRTANALVTVTNDGWFGHSTARYQHLQIAQMRSIETGRYLLRAANDGISAIIGPDGRVLATAPGFVRPCCVARWCRCGVCRHMPGLETG